MEAVLEKPQDETGSIPEFNEAAWEEKARAAYDGKLPDEAAQDEPGAALGEALGLPESFEDLWPGYAYKPPKLKQLETIIPLSDKMSALYQEGKVWEAVECAVTLVVMLAVNPDGKPVTRDEVLETFDEDEIAVIIDHMMRRQGLKLDDPNPHSGRWTGLKNFLSSAASTTSRQVNGAS